MLALFLFTLLAPVIITIIESRSFVPANPNAITIFGCDFDSDFCNIAILHDTKFGWFRTKEITARAKDERLRVARFMTNAHSRVDFLRTRARRKSTMSTDFINVASGRVCVAFNYCIRGANVQFNVSVSQKVIENELFWSKTGNAIETMCDVDFFNVHDVYMFRLLFKSLQLGFGGGFISLDNIRVYNDICYELVQGDIAAPTEFVETMREVSSAVAKVSRVGPRLLPVSSAIRWPTATILYRFTSVFQPIEKEYIRKVMQDLEKPTCLSFEETDQLESEGAVLLISNTLVECYSTFGLQPQNAPAIMNLGEGCIESDIIAHLLMHVLGYHHETSRLDRDTYITIHWENVQPGMDDRFSAYSDPHLEHLDDPYDYESIMQYRRNAYSVDMTKPTITHRLFPDIILGNKQSLSEMDVLKINRIYCEHSKNRSNLSAWHKSLPPPPGYERLVGNCPGNIILGPMSLELVDCAAKCNSTQRCRGFAFATNKQNLCFLKSDACTKTINIPGYAFYRRIETLSSKRVSMPQPEIVSTENPKVALETMPPFVQLEPATIKPKSAPKRVIAPPVPAVRPRKPTCQGRTHVVKVTADEHGHIKTPNFDNGMYFPNDECHWSVRGQPGYCIRLHFVKFEMGDGCQHATTLVFDGPTNTSDRLAALCGRTLPPDITVASNEAFVTLRTGLERTDEGFHIEASLTECPAPRCQGKQRMLTEPSGFILSPYFGVEDVMPIDFEHCHWLIRARANHLIKLSIMSMHVSSESDANCSFANVTVYDGAHPMASPLIGQFCGKHQPFHLISTGTDALVVFKTIVGRYYPGFKIHYQTFTEGTAQMPGIFHEASSAAKTVSAAVSGLSNERCNGSVQMLSEPAGTIVIGPSYEPDDMCYWDIRAPEGKCIKLLFGSFSVPNGVTDSLTVYDGPNSFSTGEFSFSRNAKPPMTFTSSSQSVFLRFASDATAKSRKDAIIGVDYLISDRCENPKCNGYFAIMTQARGRITSPGFGNGRYFPDDTCFWLFRAPINHIVRLTLNNSSISKSMACVDDSLKIYDGPHLGSRMLLAACGSYRMPKSLKTTSSEVLVSFRSGKKQSEEPGFQIEYEFVPREANCGDPPTIANAAISFSQTMTGAVAKYICKPGFIFFNEDDGLVTCEENGNWSQPLPTCQPVRCPVKLPKLENGFVASDNANGAYIYNSSLVYACNPGYRIRGKSLIFCEANGRWGATPICDPGPNCGNPPKVDNGDVYYSSTQVGSIASYHCNDYYKLEGSSSISCLSDGYWQEAPKCLRELLICPEPNLVLAHGNAHVTGKSPGDIVSYTCDAGYRLSGDDSSVCQLNGQWSAATPECVELSPPSTCPVPPLIANGLYEVTGYEAGSMLTFLCKPGYSLHGQRMAFCLTNGNWSYKVLPECRSEIKEPVCKGSPPSVENGQYSLSSNNVGAIATYTCAEGYILDGHRIVSCRENGTWSNAPQCKKVVVDRIVACPIPTPIANGNVSFPENISAGSVAVYSCNANFTLQGSSVLFCMNSGQWTPEPPVCRGESKNVECSQAPKVENGRATFWSTPLGSIAMYTCNDDYQLEGPAVSFCSTQNGWSEQPKCESIKKLLCPPPPQVRHGLVSFASTEIQSVALYACDEGYELMGSNVAICLSNATWSLPPICQRSTNGLSLTYLDSAVTASKVEMERLLESTQLPDSTTTTLAPTTTTASLITSEAERVPRFCGEPPLIPFAMVSVPNREVGATAVYRCSEGYNPQGSSIITCQPNGTWTDPPRCLEATSVLCGPAPPVRNGRILNKPTGLPGSFAEYVCLPGMKIVGEGTIKCFPTGEWSQPPECQPVLCPLPNFVDNGVVEFTRLTVGSIATYSCEAGFTLSGPSRLTCLESGDWDAAEYPLCLETRPTGCHGGPPVVTNATVTYAGTQLGSIATYKCQKGWEFANNHSGVVYCEPSGNWTQPPECRKSQIKCPIPPNPDHGFAAFDSLVAGSTASFSCDDTFALIGSPTIRCLETGEWETPPTCQQAPVTCLLPPTRQNALFSLTSLTVGSVATYRCDIGHVLVGASVVTCQSDGSWTDAPFCRAANTPCSDPPPLANGNVYFESIGVGSSATYSCNNGYILDGTPTLTCGPGGLWTTPMPRCIEIRCPIPYRLINGRVSFPSLSIGTLSTYRCDDGYTLKGPSQFQCSNDGKWMTLDGKSSDDVQPICLSVLCPPPPAITNGDVLVTSVSIGATANYTCKDGFEMVGESPPRIHCLETGEWTVSDVQCRAKSCGPPPPIPNASMGYSATKVGATTFYICLPGFVMVGASFSTCLPNGTWSLGPSCVPPPSTTSTKSTTIDIEATTEGVNTMPFIITCPDPPKIPNGIVTFTSLLPGSLAVYKCFNGFELVGSRIVDCLSDGDWSEPPYCRPFEDKPVHNAVKSASNLAVAGPLEIISIRTKSKLSTKSEPTTTTSTPSTTTSTLMTKTTTTEAAAEKIEEEEEFDYKADVADEIQLCGPPPKVAGSVAHYTDKGVGTVAIYTCNSGLTLSGNPILHCLDVGIWERPLPRCLEAVKTCEPPPQVEHGEVFYSLTTVGSLAVYKCQPKTVLEGSQVAKCLENGTWEVAPKCVVQTGCGKPPRVANSEVEFNSTSPGSVALYRCINKSMMRGSKKAYCMEDSLLWTAPPQCLELTCLPPPNIENGQVNFTALTVGSNATYSCNEPFVMNGDSVTTCLDSGRWTEAPQCLAALRCGKPPSIQFGDFFYESDEVGDEAYYNCYSGYGRNGPEKLVCRSDGRWGSPPECILLPTPSLTTKIEEETSSTGGSTGGTSLKPVECPPTPQVEHATMRTTGSQKPGTVAIYTCDEDYRMNGNKTVTCGPDGKWSALPTCLEVIGGFTCGQPPLIDHAVVSYSGMAYGAKALYTCDDGYSLTGNDEVICGKNGIWSQTPSCKPRKLCEKPPPIANAAMMYNGTGEVNDQAFYTCSVGYQIQGPSTITCVPPGIWTKIPKCLPLMGTKCPPPPNIAGATLEHYGLTPKGDAMFSLHRCRPSSDRPGTMIRSLCLQNRTWSQAPTKCLESSCDLPPEIEYSSMSRWTVLKVGTTITYSCVPGFQLKGEPTIRCQHDLSWTRPPKCQPYPVDYYDSGTEEFANNFVRDPLLGLLDIAGNNSASPLSLHLDERQVTPASPAHLCPVPPYIPNGMVWYNDLLPGSRAEVRCAPGHVIHGAPGNVFCQANHTWTQFPQCVERLCGRPPRVPNAYVVFNSVRVGATAWYQCLSSNHRLVGNRVITCLESGEWSTIPTCIKPSDDDGHLSAALPASPANDTAETLQLVNATMGTGDPALPPMPLSDDAVNPNVASVFCSYPPVVANAIIRFDHSIRGVLTAVYSCQEGFKIDGQRRIVCLPGGRWTTPPKCVEAIPEPTTPLPGEDHLGPLLEPCLGRAYTLSNTSGYFTSPRRHRTKTYFPNDVCYWTIQAFPGKCIRLQADYVRLSPCSDSDRVTIHDGSSVFSAVVAEYCGSDETKDTLLPVQSSSNYLTTVFNTNHVTEGDGFKFHYRVVDCLVTRPIVDSTLSTTPQPSKNRVKMPRPQMEPIIFTISSVKDDTSAEFDATNGTDPSNETVPLIDLASLPGHLANKPIGEIMSSHQRSKSAMRLLKNDAILKNEVKTVKPVVEYVIHNETEPPTTSSFTVESSSTSTTSSPSTTTSTTTTTTTSSTTTSTTTTSTTESTSTSSSTVLPTTNLPLQYCSDATETGDATSGIIEWPNPSHICRWVIKAPALHFVRLTIDYMKLANESSTAAKTCHTDNVTVTDALNVVTQPFALLCGLQHNVSMLTNTSDLLVQVRSTSNISDAFVYMAYTFEQSGCGEFPPSPNSKIIKLYYGTSKVGDKVILGCETGITLSGPNMATCGADGKWSPSVAICRRPCPPPPDVVNARLIRSSSFGHGTVLMPQQSASSSNNASATSTPPTTVFSEGESVLYFCHPGHVLLGPLKSVCGNDGGWSQAPKCIRSCGRIPVIPNSRSLPNFAGRDSIVGDRVKFSCRQPGAHLEGPDYVSCLPNGKWSHTPMCVSPNVQSDEHLFGSAQEKSKKASQVLHNFT